MTQRALPSCRETRRGACPPSDLAGSVSLAPQHLRRPGLVADRGALAAGVPGARHVLRRGRPWRHLLRQLLRGVRHWQHGAGDHPVRRRPAHRFGQFPNCRLAGAPPGYGRRGGHCRADRGRCALAAGAGFDRKLSDRRRGRLDRRRGGLLPPAPAWPRHQAAGAQCARGGIRPERPDRGLPDGRLCHAAAWRQHRAGVEPGSRLRQSDRRRRGNRARSGVYPGLADQPARARLRPLSDPRHGVGAVHFRRRAGARRQRLSRGLPRRADRRQPAASGGAADQPLP